VRDVATAATSHEDLGAEFLRAVHGDDRRGPAGVTGYPARPGGRKQPGRTCSNDQDIAVFRLWDRSCRQNIECFGSVDGAIIV
jgi:hypothetical protein